MDYIFSGLIPEEPLTLVAKIIVIIISIVLSLTVLYFINLAYNMMQSPLYDILEPFKKPSDIIKKLKALVEIIAYLTVSWISVGFTIGIWQVVLSC